MAEKNVTHEGFGRGAEIEIADNLYDVAALLAVVMQRIEVTNDFDTLRLLTMANEKVSAAAAVLG